MAREYLSRIDSTLLQLEDPTNPMMITGVMAFGAPIDFERLKRTVEVRLLSMHRFRQRVARSRLGLGKLYWADDPDFDLDYHIQRANLPPPGDQAVLQEAVSLLASSPLDLSKPLWQLHLLENYAGCCALVCRFHHAIADGTALMHVILSLTDSEPDAPWPAVQPASSQRHGTNRLATLARSPRSKCKKAGRRAASAVLQEGRSLATPPSHTRDLGRTGAEATKIVARFALLEPDPNTVLTGKLGLSKRAAWSEGVPLEAIKTIRRRLGGTVNDVLLTAIAGALRRYLQDRGDAVDAISLRAVVPVNLRPPGREGELSNKVGAVFLPLPVSIAHPAVRLGEIQRLMNDRKDSLEPPVFYFLLNVLGMVPARISKPLVDTFGTRATAVMTNVRGPQKRRYLTGAPLNLVLAWAPQTGPIGMGVSILSYAGQVRVGILSDEGLVPDPESILAKFHDEYEALLALARQVEQDPALKGTSAVADDDLERAEGLVADGATGSP